MSTTTMACSWQETRAKFIEVSGNTTQSFGFGRIVGQVYGLLYLSPCPLCLDDIVKELGVSKASVSTTVRQLENWSAVKQVWVKGDRKDYYEAETNFKAVLRNGVLSRLRRKLESASLQLEQAEHSVQEALHTPSENDKNQMDIIADRLKHARQFHSKVNNLLNNPLVDHLL